LESKKIESARAIWSIPKAQKATGKRYYGKAGALVKTPQDRLKFAEIWERQDVVWGEKTLDGVCRAQKLQVSSA
jgi:hypothetical protein